ncbi:MAG: hypothetical protein KJ667_07405 [Alphaproteobacteria bacterium]|nr:hypothetical protein [Alphaproteobacteria bacterium]
MTLRLLFSLSFCLLLAACGGGKPELAAVPLLPMPVSAVPHDPNNDQLMTAIAGYVATAQGPANSQYEFTRIDLDGDGRREGLVMMKNPHQFWCGIYGCRMAVFRAHNEGFSMLTEISPVRGPLTVSDTRTNGWRDLMILVDGRTGWERKQVALQFDGSAYPSQPAFLPAAYAANMITGNGVRIFP